MELTNFREAFTFPRTILYFMIFASAAFLFLFLTDASASHSEPEQVVLAKATEQADYPSQLECPVDANYSSPETYIETVLLSAPENELEAFVYRAVIDMHRINDMLASEGLTRIGRVARIDEQEARDIASQIANASRQYSDPYRTAVGLAIIAGYESNYTNDALGDCRIYDDSDNSRSRACETQDERSDSRNYIACGPTQVISNRSQILRGRPTCQQLMNPDFAYSYTARFINRFPYESGHWAVAAYSGRGSKAQRFEVKFNRILDILLDEAY
jgi:hypothetical protein